MNYAFPHTFPSGATVDADRLMGLRHDPAARPYGRKDAAGGPGSHPTRRRGAGLDIRDVRPFVEGDDPRYIDAMVSARTGATHVRDFHDDQDRLTLLVADFRRPMLWGTRGRLRSVAAADALALTGWRAVAAGARVGLLAMTDDGSVYERPRARDAAMSRIAATLAATHRDALAGTVVETSDGRGWDAERSPGLSLGERLVRLARLAPRGASISLASGCDDPGVGFDGAVLALADRVRFEVLLIRDAFERGPPRGILPYFTSRGGVRRGRARRAEAAFASRCTRLRELGVAVRIVDADMAPGEAHDDAR